MLEYFTSITWLSFFCRAMLLHERGLCRRAVSVRPSVTFMYSVETNRRVFKFLSPSGSHTILVFPYQTLQYFDGDSPNEGVECRWGRQKSRWLSDWWLQQCDQQLWRSTVQFITQTPTRQWILFITASMDDHDEESKTEFICTQQ